MVINRDIPINLVRPDAPITGKVVESTSLTPPSARNYCRHVVIDVEGTPLEGNFEVGQSFGVIPQWSWKQEDNRLRLYSIASPALGEYGEGKTIATTVKRIIGEQKNTHELFMGTASNYLCDLCEGGDVMLTGPTGKQMLLPDPEVRDDMNYVLIATGTGIAPFRGMLMELMQSGYRGEIHLIFGVPYSTDLYYGDLFAEYEDRYPNFHFYRAISREDTTPEGHRMYVQHRMEMAWERLGALLDMENTLLYICGMAGMEAGVYQLLLRHGLYRYFRNLPEDFTDGTSPTSLETGELGRILRPNPLHMRVEVY